MKVQIWMRFVMRASQGKGTHREPQHIGSIRGMLAPLEYA